MNVATLSLRYLVRPPKSELAEPPLLILLHGIGSNEQDLFALAPYLDERFLILSARAPIMLMPGSYAWFHAEFSRDGTRVNAQEAESSRLAILGFIDEVVRAYGAERARVYLMGFSQGAIMSMSIMLTRPDAVAGVVAISGRILPEVKPNMVAPERLAGFPVFVLHGTFDNVLPVSNGRASRDFLSTLPVNLDYREYQMAHQISDEILADVESWLSAQLDGDRRD